MYSHFKERTTDSKALPQVGKNVKRTYVKTQAKNEHITNARANPLRIALP
jgi:hypothetical protein